MLPAKLYLQFICSKYQFRSHTSDNSTGVEVLGDFGGPATARFCVLFRDFTQDLVRAAGVGGKGQPGGRSTRTRLGSWRESGLSWRWRGSGGPITL